jgi:hypothetical protein
LGVDERVIGQLVVFLSLFSPNKGGYVPSNDDFDIVHSREKNENTFNHFQTSVWMS